MPRRFTMLELVTRCKQRCDKEGEDHIEDPEWKSMISASYGEVYQTVAGTGMEYFEVEYSITADGSDGYDEPDDHLSTIGVERVTNAATGERIPLSEIMAQERPLWMGRTGDGVVYTLPDDKIYFYPRPSSGTYKLRYIPQPPDLSGHTDTDMVDVVTVDGEEMLIWGVAVKALAKGKEDVRLAMKERDDARARLLEWATMRALLAPRRRILDPQTGDDYGNVNGAWNPASWRYR